jgi:hypothetical protein
LLHRRIGNSALLSLLQLPSSLPLLRDCYRPSILTEESDQKKKKAEKVFFLFTAQQIEKSKSGPNF